MRFDELKFVDYGKKIGRHFGADMVYPVIADDINIIYNVTVEFEDVEVKVHKPSGTFYKCPKGQTQWEEVGTFHKEES